ncbi:CerR family C-terminal domain-containing protein [Gallionella capsiferriformans]|jgi:AcrR family transcriptional regulator|uniref:Transcriptional regulator TetR n=1 Tax=Gallionella capsiferriformans (strain ES-2) TaxID=395494 RepID=D9SE55_GALCS|nr:CerR family C-terminal domain-containing protein [Gallionella capsiferriformans]ADL56877.1 Transcriptional regulator TetR [Gallionella capsiferriformans ES-2]
MTAPSASDQTRGRLLDAAREVFSQCGFQGATVREICRRADANVAAVNYHFGSKDGLLAEALNFSALKALQSANIAADRCPEMRMRLFIKSFMLLLLDENGASRQCQMMAREMADPTPALDKIVSEAIAPLHEFLARLISEIIGGDADEAEVRRCVYSLIGQCVFYRNSHPVLQRLRPELRYDRQEIESIAAHIADFTLAALRIKRLA